MKNTTELKIDSRKIGEKGQYAKRLDIIRLYFDECYSGPKIAEVLQVSKKYVYDIINNYKQGGLDALKIKKRGRAKGAKCTLSPEQETVIKDVIFNKKPKDFGLAEMLWSKENINLMIKSTIGISLPRSTLGDYLARWGYSPQRPIKKAYKQNPQKIEEWLNYTYPEIRKRALKEEAEILFGDETAIQNTTGYMRGYAPKNNPPVVDVASKKLKINMVSVISQKGVMRFSLFKVNMNAKRFLIFLKRVVHDRVNRDGHKKVFLILDNSRVHHAKLVQAWVNENRDKIELFFLPPYAPECNPDELLNSYLKRGVGKVSHLSEKQLENSAYSFLSQLRKKKDTVASFFHSNSTLYAS